MLKRIFRLSKNLFFQTISLVFGKGKINIDLKDRESEVIIIVAETNVPRLERMLNYLRKIRTEKFVVISSKEKYRAAFFERIPDIEVYLIDQPWQIGMIIKQFKKIKLIHAFESRSIYPYFALKSKPKNCPFVFDFQDLYNNYTEDKKLAPWLKENLYYEKYCLKNADAFISYSLELNPIRRKMKLPKIPSVYFPFYLDDEAIEEPKPKEILNKINVVYAGGLAPISWNISFNMTLTEKYISGSNVYLHLYPSPSVADYIILEYEEYVKTHPNLILHKPVSNKTLAKELSQYHYALIPFFKTDAYQATDKYKYSTSLKLWNFVESGIPIIIMKDVEYQAWLVKRMGAGLVLAEEELKMLPNVLANTDYRNFESNIKSAQMTLQLSNKISVINNLYDKLIS